MGRQAALMAISERVQNNRYRFYLQNASVGLREIIEPNGWASAEYTISRDPMFWGVTSVISFNDLVFLKAARDFVRDVYEGQGINALVTFTVNRLNDNTGAYDLYFSGKLDLGTYKIEQTGVRCQVIDTSFAEKVRNRKAQKVNIHDLTSIEGYSILPFSYEDTRRLEIPTSNLWLYARYVRNDPHITTEKTHYAPMYLTAGSDFPEAQSQTISGTDPFFLSAIGGRTLVIDGHAVGTVTNTLIHEVITITFNLYANGVLVDSWNDSATGTNTLNFDVYINKQFVINTGENAYLQAVVTIGYSDTGDTTIEYTIATMLSNRFLIREIAYSLDPIWVKSWPIYETSWRVIQKITDTEVCFYSTFFGRTDTPLDTYPTDGQLGHIAKGRFIKNAESAYSHVYQNYDDFTMEMSLEELFKSLNAVYAIGMGIETIGGYARVVFEAIRYFFEDTVSIDLSGRIEEEMIGKEVIPDKHFANIQTGYNSYEYISVAGAVEEYNTKSSFSSVISAVDNVLDNVSKYRGDTNGINTLRFHAGESEDTKGEEDLFIIDSIRAAVDPDWVARQQEGFSLVEGNTDLSTYFNFLITPKRNLLRHGAIIRAGLQKDLGTYLRWQASDKNTDLQTQLDTEAVPVVENADVLVNDLTEPFYLPEFYTIDCVLYPDELETIKTTPKGLIKISATKYGWIWNLKKGSEENKVSLKLLRANLNVITPV